MNQEMDAIYFLSPQPHIVDCLMADFERRRYRKSFIIWTSREIPNLSISARSKYRGHNVAMALTLK